MDPRHFCKHLLILLLFSVTAKSECPSNWTSIKDSYFYLSDEQEDVNTAQRKCSMFGGNLAKYEDEEVINKIITKLNEEYTSDLQTVWAFKNDFYVNYDYKYAQSPVEYGRWELTGLKFKAYSRSTRQYTKIISFCNATSFTNSDYSKWHIISNAPCSSSPGWSEDFTLFGGVSNTTGTTLLYHYLNDGYSSMLSFNQDPEPIIIHNSDTIFIPNNEVYIGARSDVNQTDWVWSDQTIVNDSSFPKSNREVCQQMTLHYNDTNWNLAPQSCADKSAYFMCQIQFVAEVENDNYDGTILRVHWNKNLLDHVYGIANNLKTKVSTLSNTLAIEPFSAGNLILRNLTKLTTYALRVTVTSEECSSFSLSTNIDVRTGCGKPEPVTSAYVIDPTNQSTNDCVIEWKHIVELIIVDYHITSISEVAITDYNINAAAHKVTSHGSINIFQVALPLSDHGYDNAVTFKISSYSCGGKSKEINVTGHCVSQAEIQPLTTTNLNQSTIIAIPVALSLLVLILFLGVFLYKRRNGNFRMETGHRSFPEAQTQERHTEPTVIFTTKKIEETKSRTQAASNLNENVVYENTIKHEYEVVRFNNTDAGRRC